MEVDFRDWLHAKPFYKRILSLFLDVLLSLSNSPEQKVLKGVKEKLRHSPVYPAWQEGTRQRDTGWGTKQTTRNVAGPSRDDEVQKKLLAIHYQENDPLSLFPPLWPFSREGRAGSQP